MDRPLTVTTIGELRDRLAEHRAAGARSGSSPRWATCTRATSLMRAAREHDDVVVVSVFVNPLQFGEGEDLDTYPRDLARDTEVAAAEGVDLLFVPPVEEMYPEPVLTTVSVA